jgi:monoamine oxidase
VCGGRNPLSPVGLKVVDRAPISRRRLLQQTLLGTTSLASFAACAEEPDSSSSATDAIESGTGKQVPEPIAMIRTSWSIDPFALGSYSFMAVGATPEMRAVLAAPLSDPAGGNRVFFAGEATAADNPATVHGAQDSGRRVAAEVLAQAGTGERVVVIGAGAAGLAAARLLADDGFDVLVVEARDRVGGRIHSVRAVDDLIVELGASWVHDAQASDVADQLAELAIAVAPFDYDRQSLLGSDGQQIDDIDSFVEPATEAIAAAIDWAEDQEIDLSLADAIERSGAAQNVDPEALDHIDASEIAAEFGAAAAELSTWWGQEEGSNGDDLIVLGGYDAIIREMADGLNLEMQRPVRRIEWDPAGVLVVDESGNEMRTDRVVVTVPLGVLKSGAIEFEPPLPDDKLEVIDRIGFGLLDKVWFVFNEAFWTEDSLMWNIVSEEGGPYREWFNLQPLIGKPVLLSLVGGEVARDWAQRSDADVKEAALRQLQQFIDAGW